MNQHIKKQTTIEIPPSSCAMTSVGDRIQRKRDVDSGGNQPPTIDLSGIDGPDRKRIGEEIARACEKWGFFQIINHSIEISLLNRTKEVFTQFFHLDEEEKQKIKAYPRSPEKYMKWGYRAPNKNDVITNAPEHLANSYLSGDQEEIDRQPSNPPSFRTTVAEYVQALNFLFGQILGVLSEELGVARGRLRSFFVQKEHIIRSNFYQPSHGKLDVWTFSAHSDVHGGTLLLSDEVTGTQIKTDDGWVAVVPVANALLFNVGDQVEILSNGRYKSVVHRGMPHETQERLCIATFLGPDQNTVIGPLPELLDESHPPVYNTIAFGSYLNGYLENGLAGSKFRQSTRSRTEI